MPPPLAEEPDEATTLYAQLEDEVPAPAAKPAPHAAPPSAPAPKAAAEETEDDAPTRIAEMFDPRTLLEETDTSVDHEPFGTLAAPGPLPEPAPPPARHWEPEAVVSAIPIEDAPTTVLPSSPPPPIDRAQPALPAEAPQRHRVRWFAVVAAAALGAALVGVGFLLGVSHRTQTAAVPSASLPMAPPSTTASAVPIMSAHPAPIASSEAVASASAGGEMRVAPPPPPRARARSVPPSAVPEPAPTPRAAEVAPPGPTPAPTAAPTPRTPETAATPLPPAPSSQGKRYVSPIQNPGF